MPDALIRLREADPAGQAPTAVPPRDVLDRIVATPPVATRRAPRPRPVLAALALAAAAVLALPGSGSAPGTRLAERAFAATAPSADFITYTETTTVQRGPGAIHSRDHVRQWQYRDRMHDFMVTTQPRGTWTYEHHQAGGTFRTLLADGEVQVTRRTDPGWDPRELEEGLEAGVTTLLNRFREHIRGARDLGETTFNGRPARAYLAAATPGARVPPGETTYYVDPDTALPLGSETTLTAHAPQLGDGKPVAGTPFGTVTITTTVDRYEQLPPTAANLAELDAPNLDAAQRRN